MDGRHHLQSMSPIDDTLIGPHNLESINSPPPTTNSNHYRYPPAHLAPLRLSISEDINQQEDQSNKPQDFTIVMPVDSNKEKRNGDDGDKSSERIELFKSAMCCIIIAGIILPPLAPILCMVTRNGNKVKE